MNSGKQTTLAGRVDLEGCGVHSGKPVSLSLLPADPDTGIVFVRTDMPQSDQSDIPALSSSVGATALCTVLGDPSGLHVMTVEHLMAALMGIGVDNVLVEVDSPEIPVMDGSSEVFIDAIDRVGIHRQNKTRRYLRVLKEVKFESGDSWGMFTPGTTTRFDVEIDFNEAAIGNQHFCADMTPEVFRKDISRARTFGFMRDVERYWAAGFALGSSLENSVVIGDDNEIVNPEGLRYSDEFVRHKTLDAVGDLALAGAPFLGCYKSYKGGHKVNAMALEKLLSDPSNYEWTDASGRALRTISAVQPVQSSGAMVAVSGPAYAADKN